MSLCTSVLGVWWPDSLQIQTHCGIACVFQVPFRCVVRAVTTLIRVLYLGFCCVGFGSARVSTVQSGSLSYRPRGRTRPDAADNARRQMQGTVARILYPEEPFDTPRYKRECMPPQYALCRCLCVSPCATSACVDTCACYAGLPERPAISWWDTSC